jgi:LysR family transcriptional activator of nhaA
MTSPPRLNLKHLRYFLEVARRGSVSAAARALFVAPQTVSAQLRELEASVGHALFERVGRRLRLSPEGEIAQDYAATIFALGDELRDVLGGRAQPRRRPLRLGIVDSIPKLLTVALLEPLVLRHGAELELTCREGSPATLLGMTAARELDAVLTETPVPPTLARSLGSRLLVEAGLSFMAIPALAARLRRRFPASLDGAPFIAGLGSEAPLPAALDAWFAELGVQPRIAGRFDDSALMKSFAGRGLGVIAVPTLIEAEVARQHRLRVAGRTTAVRLRVFLVRPVGRRPNPLVAEIGDPARRAHG